MGACHNKGSATYITKGRNAVEGGAVKANSSERLKTGEEAFVSFAPTGLRPEGEPIIAKTADGGYRYLGEIPDYDRIRVDSNSDEYKQAEKDFNVTVRMYADGTLKVMKGGLYDRTKTYKDAEAFRKDVKKRIDARSSYDTKELDSLKQGRISQLEAESFRGIVKKNSSSMAVKKMNDTMRTNMQNVKARIKVADKAREKADRVTDSLKRQLGLQFGLNYEDIITQRKKR